MHPRIHPALTLAGVSILALVGLIGALLIPDMRNGEHRQLPEPLIVQCAASQRLPVAEIAEAYQSTFGQPIEIRYGPSEALLNSIQLTGQGDIFLPADDSYVAEAQRLGLVAEVLPVTRMHAVLAVAAGNPKKIRTWTDVLSGDIRLAQANTAAAIGKLTRDHLTKTGHWDELNRKTTVELGTVTDVANAVKVGSVDAGIVWDAVARPMSKVEMIELPELAGIQAIVQVAVVKQTPRLTEASRFAHYLASPETGQPHFLAHGFSPARVGDQTAPHP